MIGGVLRNSVSLIGRNILNTQKRNIVSGPPLRRMPFPQKLLIGGSAVFLAMVPVPAYILVNIKYYNGSAYRTAEEEEDDDDE